MILAQQLSIVAVRIPCLVIMSKFQLSKKHVDRPLKYDVNHSRAIIPVRSMSFSILLSIKDFKKLNICNWAEVPKFFRIRRLFFFFFFVFLFCFVLFCFVFVFCFVFLFLDGRIQHSMFQVLKKCQLKVIC